MNTLVHLVIVLALVGSTVPAAAQDRAKGEEPSFKALLLELCSGTSNEPACKTINDLSNDQAWLILRTACRSDSSDVCKEFRIGYGGVLIYDWRSDSWSAEWEKEQYPLKIEVSGVPTARLKPRDARPLRVMIDNISPLTYSAVPGVPKEEDLGVITGLKSFLTAAGTALQGTLKVLTLSSPSSAARGQADDAATLSVDRDRVSSMRRGQPPPPVCAPQPPETNTLADAVTIRMQHLLGASSAIDRLERQVDNLAGKRSDFLRAAQKAEDGQPVTLAELTEPAIAALEAAYDDLASASSHLRKKTDPLATCQPLMAAYVHLLSGPPNRKVMEALANRIIANPQSWACDALEVKPIADSIRNNAAQLVRDIEGCDLPAVKTHLETHRDTMKPMVERLMNAKQVEEKLWTALAKAAESRKEVLAGAHVLSRRVRHGQRHTWGGKLIPALVVTRQFPVLPWNKIQTHEIIAKADSPYAKELTLRRGAEEKRSYKLESATGQVIGYGVGLIYTPLQESTYAAVAVPGETTKVIRETGRETRAGDLAAFLTYRFLEHRPRPRGRKYQPVLDIGVGLTSDRPAFFIGPAFEIARAARIGIGWAPQRVTKLDDQTPDVTVVADASEIRTKKAFEVSNWYVSFSFALDSLSLFNAK